MPAGNDMERNVSYFFRLREALPHCIFILMDSNPSTAPDLINKIKQLLLQQRFAVHRASSIGMSQVEAVEMETRITQMEELLDRIHAHLS